MAWKYGIERADGPTALIFCRQNLPHQPRDAAQLADVARGGYVLKDCDGEPEVILIATGSEVGLAVQAYDKLSAEGRKVRVVSMPSTSVFDQQDAAYKQSVLPVQVGRAHRHRSGPRRLLVQVRGPGRPRDRHDHLR